MNSPDHENCASLCRKIVAGQDSYPSFTMTYQQLYLLLMTCGYSQKDIQAIGAICQEQWLLLLENVYYFLMDRFKLDDDDTEIQKQKREDKQHDNTIF